MGFILNVFSPIFIRAFVGKDTRMLLRVRTTILPEWNNYIVSFHYSLFIDIPYKELEKLLR